MIPRWHPAYEFIGRFSTAARTTPQSGPGVTALLREINTPPWLLTQSRVQRLKGQELFDIILQFTRFFNRCFNQSRRASSRGVKVAMSITATLQSTLSSTLRETQSEIESLPLQVDPEVISPPTPVGSYLVDESVIEGTADESFPRRKSTSTHLRQHSQYRAQNWSMHSITESLYGERLPRLLFSCQQGTSKTISSRWHLP